MRRALRAEKLTSTLYVFILFNIMKTCEKKEKFENANSYNIHSTYSIEN